MMLWLVLASTAIAATPPLTVPPITVAEANGLHRVTIPDFDAPLLVLVEAAVNARAVSACGVKDVSWGSFSYNEVRTKAAIAAPRLTAYRREFRCLDIPPVAVARAPADWKPGAADERDIRRAFAAFYTQRDAGAVARTLALFEPGALKNEVAYAQDVVAQNMARGRGSRRITGVTWYVNPDNAAHAGIFGAVDFAGDYPALQFYCGFIGMWRRGPGDYLVVREEQGMFPRGKVVPDPAELAAARAALCRT